MSVYFYLNEVLDHINTLNNTELAWTLLSPVYTTPPDCGGYSEDAFVISKRFNILDLNTQKAADSLTDLLETIPLYNINLEMVLDDALTERHNNEALKKALLLAFGDRTLPNTLHNAGDTDLDNLGGSLQHPILDHIDAREKCRIYLEFLNILGVKHTIYNFSDAILGKHQEKFLDIYDGFIHGDLGMVRSDLILQNGVRVDHQDRRPDENYIENGKRIAADMALENPHDIIWAWLEADHYQMRRCRDIHQMMTIQGLPKLPSWIRTDTRVLLEKESIKQYLAEMLVKIDPNLSTLEKTPDIKKGMKYSTNGQVDELLQQLLSQTLNQDTGYSGTAGKFAESAAIREKEAHLAQLS